MKETSNKRAVFVGLFVITGILILVAGVLMVGNLHETFKSKIELVTFFDDVNGLQKGNNIWYSGVKIGVVSDMRFYGESQVRVGMKIDDKLQQYVHKDARVKIGTDGLIGNKILVIYGGTPVAPNVQEGDTLWVEKTFTSEDMLNTLQENNKNLLVITTDFKNISSDIKGITKNLSDGKGSVGKLLNDNTLYNNIDAVTLSLKSASQRAEKLVSSLADYSEGLNKEGTLANQLVTDTVVFSSIKASAMQLQNIADTAAVFITSLKEAGNNPNSPVGVLLHNEKTGAQLKETIRNLESGSDKLDENLEALQHNILLRRYFKKKAKEGEKGD